MIEKQVSLKKLNTFGFDVAANLFCEIDSITTLGSLWKTTLLPQSNTLILGGGSNLVFRGDYQGLILKNALWGREIVEDTNEYVLVKIGSGENWHQTVLWAVEAGLGGIENLSLIPGTIGAAPIQNIGAYGVELVQVFEWLEAFDLWEGKMVQLSKSDCQFGYRDSIFKREAKGRYYITSVVLKLKKQPEIQLGYGDVAALLESWGIQNPGIADVSKAIIQIRQSKLPDPAEIGNCGSFFKNPVIPESLFQALHERHPDIKSFPAGHGQVKVPAGWLIEKAGWKGYREGDAGVHARQALVLVNYGNASGNDIYQLALKVQQDILEKFEIALEMEVNIR